MRLLNKKILETPTKIHVKNFTIWLGKISILEPATTYKSTVAANKKNNFNKAKRKSLNLGLSFFKIKAKERKKSKTKI